MFNSKSKSEVCPVAAVLIGILTLLCLALAVRSWATGRALRGAARQLAEQSRTGSSARLLLQAPSRAAEELVAAVNGLLERRQAEEAGYQARERELREQIANISHDLRTPLTSILGYLQLLEDPGLSESDRQAYLKVVESRSKALQELITSFYDLSRLEGGELPLARERVDLVQILSSLLAAFYNDLTGAGMDVHVDLAQGLPQVWADPNAALRIFTNLLRNAMDHGSGRLDVRLYREGEAVVSAFTNDAPDMAPEDVDRVFDRFFTADKMRTGRNTGLGLAIVKSLAVQMDCVPQAELAGGRFTVYIRWKC